MTQETALGAALKSAVQTMSKKKQTDMIAEYLYSKYDVFKRFKPLAIGIEKDLVEALPQFDAVLIHRVLSNHCRRPKYLKAVARGGKRFNLNNRFQGEVSEQEQQYALSQPNIREAIEKQDARRAEVAAAKAAAAQVEAEQGGAVEAVEAAAAAHTETVED